MRQTWKWWVGLWALVGLTLTPVTTPAAGVPERRTPLVVAIEKVKPCVVSITSEKKAASNSRWPFSPEESQRPRVNGMGTGVLIDGRGYILTNQHVVDKVQGVEVHLADGSSYPARVLQQDEAMDVAILKIEAGRPLAAIVIGTSSDLMVGEQVITIGNAFGYEGTASTGIISYVGRNVTLSDDQIYRNLIQTDACINPGNSGGPLVNIDGELIGINVAVRAGAQGIGFALPIDDVKRVATEMMSTRRLAFTWHGLIGQEANHARGRSVVLADVQVGSPAEAAGFRRGDQVVKVNELAVNTPLDIERGLLDIPAGKGAEVLVRRGDQEKKLVLEPRPLNRPRVETGDLVWQRLGLKVTPVSREYVQGVSKEFNGGLWVQAVAPQSPAARAAIQPGDILVGVNTGTNNWATIRLDNISYILKLPEVRQNGLLQCYIIRQNAFVQRPLTLAEEAPAGLRR